MNTLKGAIHELSMNGHLRTPKKYQLADTQFSRYLSGQRLSRNGYEHAFMNTQKMPPGQQPLSQVPIRS